MNIVRFLGEVFPFWLWSNFIFSYKMDGLESQLQVAESKGRPKKANLFQYKFHII